MTLTKEGQKEKPKRGKKRMLLLLPLLRKPAPSVKSVCSIAMWRWYCSVSERSERAKRKRTERGWRECAKKKAGDRARRAGGRPAEHEGAWLQPECPFAQSRCGSALVGE